MADPPGFAITKFAYQGKERTVYRGARDPGW
jgi:hypothetical protein